MTLNIYTPRDHHDRAFLIADRQGLEQLKAAIELALTKGRSEYNDFDSDGAEYPISVLLDEKMESALQGPIGSEEYGVYYGQADRRWRGMVRIEEIFDRYKVPGVDDPIADRARWHQAVDEDPTVSEEIKTVLRWYWNQVEALETDREYREWRSAEKL